MSNTQLTSGDWSQKSWGEIAVALARRAAYLNTRVKTLGSENTTTTFIPYSVLKDKCGKEPQGSDWTWVYYPLLVRLLAKRSSVARLVTIGQFRQTSSGQLHRRWLNYFAEDVKIIGWNAAHNLASLLNIDLSAQNDTRFSDLVVLTTDIVEKINQKSIETIKQTIAEGRDTVHSDHFLLASVALFLGSDVPEASRNVGKLGAGPFNSLVQSIIPFGFTKTMQMMAECENWSLEKCPWAKKYIAQLAERAEKLKFEELRNRISNKPLETILAELVEVQNRLPRGLLWLGDICKSVGANCVMAIPAWLPPDSDGIQTGTLVVYTDDREFPWMEFNDIVSAYHSGGLMYLGKAEHERIEGLRKYQQMVDLLAAPLANVTNALSTMQRDTQELRAVLYEPAKAIFESHSRISDLFKEDQEIHVSPDIRFIAAHQPTRYNKKNCSPLDDKVGHLNLSEESAVICVIVAVCRIFGVERGLRKAQNLPALRVAAGRALNRASEKAFKGLREDILWLWTKAQCETPLDSIQEIAEVSVRDAVLFLETFKAITFSPFKVDAVKWDCRAIELAMRPYLSNKAVVYENLDGARGVFSMKLGGRSPATYSTILDFLMQVCVSRASRKPTMCKIHKKNQNGTDVLEIAVTFNEPFECSGLGGIEETRQTIDSVLHGLRDWRVFGANVGNYHGPFIDLANRLLGVVRKQSGDCPVGFWCAETCGKNEVISLQTSIGRKFKVILCDEGSSGELKILWQ